MTNRTRTSTVAATHSTRAAARKSHLAGVAAAIGLATLISGCGRGDSPLIPTPGSPPAATRYMLSGVVTEVTPAGSTAVEGMRVQEINSGQYAMSDADGSYSIPGLPARSISVAASKAGYVTDTKTLIMSGDTQLDFRVGRIVMYTLSGVVFEMTAEGQVPLEGVEVYCDACEHPDGHTRSYTDRDGLYSFSSVLNGTYALLVHKAGYVVLNPSSRLGNWEVKIATVKGDTRFNIELVRP